MSERLRTERFRGHYGLSPAAYAAVFVDLQKMTPGFVPNLEKLLLVGRFLFLYASRVALAGATGLDESTVAKLTWEYLPLLQRLKDQKVSCDFRSREIDKYTEVLSHVPPAIDVTALKGSTGR
jgi:hypothetical protein